eukprot:scaffold81753_cov18-Tisochrysis_lutea.AAC.2
MQLPEELHIDPLPVLGDKYAGPCLIMLVVFFSVLLLGGVYPFCSRLASSHACVSCPLPATRHALINLSFGLQKTLDHQGLRPGMRTAHRHFKTDLSFHDADIDLKDCSGHRQRIES